MISKYDKIFYLPNNPSTPPKYTFLRFFHFRNIFKKWTYSILTSWARLPSSNTAGGRSRQCYLDNNFEMCVSVSSKSSSSLTAGNIS